jgi:hypothetical protein
LPEMNTSVTGRQDIWNERFVADIVEDVGLLLNFAEGKVGMREKGDYSRLANVLALDLRNQ